MFKLPLWDRATLCWGAGCGQEEAGGDLGISCSLIWGFSGGLQPVSPRITHIACLHQANLRIPPLQLARELVGDRKPYSLPGSVSISSNSLALILHLLWVARKPC